LTAKYRIHFNFQNPQKIAYSAAKVELPNKRQKVDYISQRIADIQQTNHLFGSHLTLVAKKLFFVEYISDF